MLGETHARERMVRAAGLEPARVNREILNPIIGAHGRARTDNVNLSVPDFKSDAFQPISPHAH